MSSTRRCTAWSWLTSSSAQTRKHNHSSRLQRRSPRSPTTPGSPEAASSRLAVTTCVPGSPSTASNPCRSSEPNSSTGIDNCSRPGGAVTSDSELRHGQPEPARNDRRGFDKYRWPADPHWPRGLELTIYDDGRVKVGGWYTSAVVLDVSSFGSGS